LNSVLRRHPTPKLDSLEGLGKIVEEKMKNDAKLRKLALGNRLGDFKFQYDSNKSLADTLEMLNEMGGAEESQANTTDSNDATNDDKNDKKFSNSKKRRREERERALALNNQNQSKDSSSTNKSPTQILIQLIKMMTTRCMNQAVYFPTGDIPDREQFQHYGLAMGLYTHFTSPIRRYADVLVHRLLMHSLGLEDFGVNDLERVRRQASLNDSTSNTTGGSTALSLLPVQLSSRERLREQCDRINLKHKMAQWCGRASADFHTYLK